MSNWDFRPEKNQNNAGSTTTNPTGGLKAGFQPFSEADTLKSKRNVVATNKGWVRRTHKKNSGSSTTRQIDEVLVAANPGTSTGYAGAGYLGFPDIAQIYMQNSTSDSVTTIAALTGGGGSEHQICVVFNEPIKFNSAVKAKVALANTAGGVNSLEAVTTSAVNSNTNIINANNTLVFRFTPDSDTDTGTYKIAAATAGIANGSTGTLALVGITSGEVANTTITGAVSNNFTFTITAG